MTKQQQLAELLKTAIPYQPDEIVLEDDHPDTIASAFEKYSPVQHRYHFIDGWSIYHNDKYRHVEDEREIESYIRGFLLKTKIRTRKRIHTDDGYKYEIRNSPASAKLKSKSSITNIMTWLRDKPGVKLLPRHKAPAILNGLTLDTTHTLAMNNGLLDIRNPLKPVLHPFSPNFYTFNYLPFDFDPKAKAPIWLKSLGEYFQDDSDKPDELVPDILHQWIYDFLTSNTAHHKIQVLIGRRRSGKGTIGRTIQRLLGSSNISNISIASLSTAHGLQPLLNKQLGIMWDASITGRSSDNNKAVEILKNISGEDGVQINPKGKPMIDMDKLPLSIMMIANRVQDLRDPTGALAGRFTFLETTKSFYGSENPQIELDIAKELPGILNMVLQCPKGKRIEHPKSAMLQQQFEELSSPYVAFINECCVIDKGKFIPIDILWYYYCKWCEGTRHIAPSPQKFRLDMRGAHDNIDTRRLSTKHDIDTILGMYYLDQTLTNLDQHLDHVCKMSPRPNCFIGIDLMSSYLDAHKLPLWPDDSQGVL